MTLYCQPLARYFLKPLSWFTGSVRSNCLLGVSRFFATKVNGHAGSECSCWVSSLLSVRSMESMTFQQRHRKCRCSDCQESCRCPNCSWNSRLRQEMRVTENYWCRQSCQLQKPHIQRGSLEGDPRRYRQVEAVRDLPAMKAYWLVQLGISTTYSPVCR